ncbi:putative ABC transporter, permease protein 2 (Cluster 1, maltose/g3p/polyamine/iron) [Actinacidiphila bryophytorum]|uniref:ABC transporter, permease protein 2 (Cluster 1, maltose/g3p/polyamine/iron) n=1 Tax=Actinacidiphila bryophytorum TaxID=1436133 RepID=A0A9W4H7G9_9ACTN|nr:putative ABC transporter, permease protein 2 (Cluster 1, maltose/g3p/polyamine/iron) [Actinacidiphila bryophytorum]
MGPGGLPGLPDRRVGAVAAADRVRAVRGRTAVQRHPQVRLRLDAAPPDAEELQRRVDAVGHAALLLELGHDHGSGGGHRAGAGVGRGLRTEPGGRQVQRRAADPVHGRQPAAPAGDHHPALPAVPEDHPAALRERQRADVQLHLRPDRHQRGLPAGLLRLRAEQLHEVGARGDVRGRAGGRGVAVDPLLAADHPAVPAGARGAGHAADDVDLQRLLLGDHPDVVGRQAPGDLGAGEPAGAVRQQPEPHRGCRDDRGGADPGGLHPAAEAVHRRPVAGRQQGLSGQGGADGAGGAGCAAGPAAVFRPRRQEALTGA